MTKFLPKIRHATLTSRERRRKGSCLPSSLVHNNAADLAIRFDGYWWMMVVGRPCRLFLWMDGLVNDLIISFLCWMVLLRLQRPSSSPWAWFFPHPQVPPRLLMLKAHLHSTSQLFFCLSLYFHGCGQFSSDGLLQSAAAAGEEPPEDDEDIIPVKPLSVSCNK